jgi:thiosulfate dehydrogenase
MQIPTINGLLLLVIGAVMAPLLLVACERPDAGEAGVPASHTVVAAPDPSTIPEGPVGDSIRRGLEIATRTHEVLPDKVGNGLHCTSCHLEAGTKADAGPWIGLLSVFPEYRARSGKVDPIEQRVNDCFERSMNGTALDPTGDDMVAILAYIGFISRGVPAGVTPGRGFKRTENPPAPNRDEGARLYAEKCAACHGESGEGRKNGEAYLFPALGGPESFNIGAGMARLDTAAAFIRWNMPVGLGGTLTDREAYSIADYFIHFERPDFPGKDEDWPLGGKPRDARY